MVKFPLGKIQVQNNTRKFVNAYNLNRNGSVGINGVPLCNEQIGFFCAWKARRLTIFVPRPITTHLAFQQPTRKTGLAVVSVLPSLKQTVANRWRMFHAIIYLNTFSYVSLVLRPICQKVCRFVQLDSPWTHKHCTHPLCICEISRLSGNAKRPGVIGFLLLFLNTAS